MIQASQQVEISFLALDSERIGDGVDDTMFQDFGDNILKSYCPDKRFVACDIPLDDDDSIDEANIVDNNGSDDDVGDEGSEDNGGNDSDREVGRLEERLDEAQDSLCNLFSPSVLKYLQYK